MAKTVKVWIPTVTSRNYNDGTVDVYVGKPETTAVEGWNRISEYILREASTQCDSPEVAVENYEPESARMICEIYGADWEGVLFEREFSIPEGRITNTTEM